MTPEIMKLLAAALAIGLASFGPGIGQGLMAAKAMEAMGRNPAASKDIFTRLLIAMAFTESIAVYGLVTTLMILFL